MGQRLRARCSVGSIDCGEGTGLRVPHRSFRRHLMIPQRWCDIEACAWPTAGPHRPLRVVRGGAFRKRTELFWAERGWDRWVAEKKGQPKKADWRSDAILHRFATKRLCLSNFFFLQPHSTQGYRRCSLRRWCSGTSYSSPWSPCPPSSSPVPQQHARARTFTNMQ